MAVLPFFESCANPLSLSFQCAEPQHHLIRRERMSRCWVGKGKLGSAEKETDYWTGQTVWLKWWRLLRKTGLNLEWLYLLNEVDWRSLDCCDFGVWLILKDFKSWSCCTLANWYIVNQGWKVHLSFEERWIHLYSPPPQVITLILWNKKGLPRQKSVKLHCCCDIQASGTVKRKCYTMPKKSINNSVYLFYNPASHLQFSFLHIHEFTLIQLLK